MKAVVLAGGQGTRLQPYTTVLPKPLMPVGDRPILDTVLRQLKGHGITDVTLAVGHLAELLMAYIGDGSKVGVDISYSREDEPLGTAGPLSLVPNLDEPFLVMNGDVLTGLDFTAMFDYHRERGSIATVAVCPRDVKIELGVVEFDDESRLVDYIEKPEYSYWVSMGIYVFEPEVLQFLPAGEKSDLPDLLLELRSQGHTVNCFQYDGYWLDIGRPDDYEQAVKEFPEIQAELFGQAPDDG